ncbi:MAG: TraY domain-containing protein [Bifidobacteriaceae bacterium]|jgi:RHH-type rel operon transcriptional repressor/antitoxin RelB|nr:TraY domain-containing protein [Bifidobacteriaceae bacterium]
MLLLRLPPEIDKRLAAIAARMGGKKSFYARQAIIAHIDELEELYWDDQTPPLWEESDD